MSFMVLLGIALIAYSPPLALAILTVAGSAELVVLLISSAFFWLVSILLTSVIWYPISSLHDEYVWAVFLAVTFQEVFRWLYYKMVKRAENGLLKVADFASSPLVSHRLAYVSGLGFGIMSGLIQFNAVLSVASGPGMLPAPGCPGTSYYLISAFTTMCFILLHTFWNIVFFDGMETKSVVKTAIVPLGHLAASLLTLQNEKGNSCSGSLIPLYGELFIFAGLSYLIIRKKLHASA